MVRTACALIAVIALWGAMPRAAPSVHTVFGTGTAGSGDRETRTPFGFAIGPDGALYLCEMDGQRVRRLDLVTKRVATVAGTGERGYSGDGGPAVAATLNMPHELQFDAAGDLYVADRDSHTIRKIDLRTGIISTVAGTGVAGFSGDGGAARAAQLRAPHCLLADGPDTLLICDVGNHRIRRLHLHSGMLDTYAGSGEAGPTPEGAPVTGTPLNGPRALARSPNGDLYVALREGNAVYRIDAPHPEPASRCGHWCEGLLRRRRSGAGCHAVGPEGPRLRGPGDAVYRGHGEPRDPPRGCANGPHCDGARDGQPGDGPEPDPLRCLLSRPTRSDRDPRRRAAGRRQRGASHPAAAVSPPVRPPSSAGECHGLQHLRPSSDMLAGGMLQPGIRQSTSRIQPFVLHRETHNAP